MKRYRIWEANREVFLYPENWLIESQRPNRTETYKQLEQGVRQGELTEDYLETVVLQYIDGVDERRASARHRHLPGPVSGAHLRRRPFTSADPPTYYQRTFADGEWSAGPKVPWTSRRLSAFPRSTVVGCACSGSM